ncbi:hypothetical protein L2E82_48951 [Cichorium intybus]|uniref:Uncharacterized protein n=1 Tax=Cichorium intybus TaxID=13427 RepID=A0ACB8Z0L8_CICIN|nr:hypothetical protein L2E82_48951 [Cichorium intybus]
MKKLQIVSVGSISHDEAKRFQASVNGIISVCNTIPIESNSSIDCGLIDPIKKGTSDSTVSLVESSNDMDSNHLSIHNKVDSVIISRSTDMNSLIANNNPVFAIPPINNEISSKTVDISIDDCRTDMRLIIEADSMDYKLNLELEINKK